ncbi:MAG: TetR/AcrR family transcriptional regulator C-terminal domain-containing protein [Rhizobiales bacterium]|nr:TetR/AcrR family transcriptional regulator C-terminal domain-containing protein [Hyphomicrobiales bacterium]
MSQPEAPTEQQPSPRQIEVLEATLRQMLVEGQAVTMNSVARAASCSKETLYKWFGDREGLLTATVKWKASRVHVGAIEPGRLDRAALVARLEEFASNWLAVISSETSIALNRIAMGEAGTGKHSLGAIVLENGRFALGARLKPVLEAGRAARLLEFQDSEEAFRTFFGLMARDVQIRLLLGDALVLSSATIHQEAARAATQFLALYGVENPTGSAG